MSTETDAKNLHIDEDNPFLLLSDTQWRYVTLRIDNPSMSKKDAAEALEMSPQTIYHWPRYVDAALEKAREDMHSAALTVRKNALLKAMRVKMALLDSIDERVRDKAATDILEWELGKANQPLTGKNGDAIKQDVTLDLSSATIEQLKALAAWDAETTSEE